MQKFAGIALLIIIMETSVSKAASMSESLKNIDDYKNISGTVYSSVIIRKSRETDKKTPLTEETDRLKNEISSFSESFRKESNIISHRSLNRTNSTGKIANLDAEIQKVKGEIDELKNAANVDLTTKMKLISLESTIETLQKLFDDNNKLSESQLENMESTIDALTISVSVYMRELKNLKNLMDEKDQIDKERWMPGEIAQNIIDGEHSTAFRKLVDLSGDFRKNAIHVVRAANITHGNNFERMIDFANTLYKEPEKNVKFDEALRDEMESIHFSDVVQILKFVKSFKLTIILNYDDIPYMVIQSAIILMENLKSTARDIASGKIEEAMMNDKYRSIIGLCEQISLEDYLAFNGIIQGAIKNVINRIGAYKLVTFIKEHKFMSQRIFGYSAIFNELKTRDRLNDPAVVFLAYDLKNLMEMKAYQITASEVHDAAEYIKSALAKSVRNLAFSKRAVCIKNRDRQERLFAGDYQSFDESRRRVSTWIPGTRVSRDEWIIFPVEYVFFIKNYNVGEYLYAADDNHKLDLSRRRVLTWIPGDTVKQGRWSIEPNGDDVYIKNYIHNEYLYADYITHSRDRTVFTWGSGSKPSYSLWTIEDCS